MSCRRRSGFITLSSLLVGLFRGKVFSLPRPQLLFVSALAVSRIVVNTALLALMWYIVLPEVDLRWWFLLSTIRILLTRLPFVPNQDGLFVSVAIVLIGSKQTLLAETIAMVAGLNICVHLVIGVLIFINDLVAPLRRRA